jgi:hypothetical protein
LPEATLTERFGDFIAVPRASVGRDRTAWKNGQLPKAMMKGHRDRIICSASVHHDLNERLNILPDAKESGHDLGFDIRESTKNPTTESNEGFWLITVCICEHQEALVRALLDIFTKVSSEDQIGGLYPSRKGLLVSHAFDSTTDTVFRRIVPKDFRHNQIKVKLRWWRNLIAVWRDLLRIARGLRGKMSFSFSAAFEDPIGALMGEAAPT